MGRDQIVGMHQKYVTKTPLYRTEMLHEVCSGSTLLWQKHFKTKMNIINTHTQNDCTFFWAMLTVLLVGGLAAAGDIFYWDWRAWKWLSGLVWTEPACWSPAAHIATGTFCPSTTSVGWLTRSGNSSGAALCRTPWIHLYQKRHIEGMITSNSFKLTESVLEQRNI